MKILDRMNGKKFFLYGFLAFVVTSCTARQEINYMTDIDNMALDNAVKNSRSTLQPGDQLIVNISARDMDAVKPFNQNYSSSTTVTQYSMPSSNSMPQQLPVSGPTYFVDTDYNIVFPQLGKINTKGENIETFRDKLSGLLEKYIKDPIVDVKLVNFKVSLAGEVAKPGTYVIPEGNATVWSALALAGDLTPYGVRQNVLLIRNVDGQITKQRIDLTSAGFMNSPYYYLKQNDIIYVQPNANREKAARVDPNLGLYISVSSVVASLVIGIISLTRR
ncbi:polysaccharide biosynthesis/export family protein [Chryseobacterium caseinilyticum]|uniref:Polysaccharide biosynthesis/export family protein n=1 Tax=Chryseobacterium caseinilyticum TaxID=2771428 RepID=A0ABR8ZB73_9FLAO|nr:polysaccharide biosynthesis/export family protein [Chryseobacterium caseinilyticum]MBD8082334.1 polysaccharide biosynthesis/export family protein [Chryseobacterium caseinilyticum]